MSCASDREPHLFFRRKPPATRQENLFQRWGVFRGLTLRAESQNSQTESSRNSTLDRIRSTHRKRKNPNHEVERVGEKLDIVDLVRRRRAAHAWAAQTPNR